MSPCDLRNFTRCRLRSRAGLLVALCALCPCAVAAADSNGGEVETLFDGKSFTGWVYCSADRSASRENTWRIAPDRTAADAVLVCLGKPFGYLRTDREFENYVLSLEWSYPGDPNANSGVLVHTSGPDMIWPRAIQVQLHRPEAGSIFPEGGAVTDNVVHVHNADLAPKVWHRCVVTSNRGKISVVINDKKAVEVTGCRPGKGWIGLQSEGSEVHFRRIQIRRLK